MYELKFTPFNTIKGNYFDEISVDKFFKKIEKGINKCSKYRQSKDLSVELCYKANVYKLDNNYYKVSFLNIQEYSDYYIRTDDYPQYNAKLDGYCNITKMNDYESKCYNKLENNERGTTDDKAAYFRYLKKIIKCCNLNIFKKALIALRLPFSMLGLLLSINYSMPFSVGIFVFLWIRSCIHFGDAISNGNLYSNEYSYSDKLDLFEGIKERHFLKQRMSNIRKTIGNNHIVKTEEKVIASYDEKKYKNDMYNYMNTIMAATDKLNPDDKAQILNELKEIYEEYKLKCKEMYNEEYRAKYDELPDNDIVLKLDAGERPILRETLDKLADLNFKLSEMLKRDNNIKKLFAEDDEFMEQLDGNIKKAEESKKLTLSRGK